MNLFPLKNVTPPRHTRAGEFFYFVFLSGSFPVRLCRARSGHRLLSGRGWEGSSHGTPPIWVPALPRSPRWQLGPVQAHPEPGVPHSSPWCRRLGPRPAGAAASPPSSERGPAAPARPRLLPAVPGAGPRLGAPPRPRSAPAPPWLIRYGPGFKGRCWGGVPSLRPPPAVGPAPPPAPSGHRRAGHGSSPTPAPGPAPAAAPGLSPCSSSIPTFSPSSNSRPQPLLQPQLQPQLQALIPAPASNAGSSTSSSACSSPGSWSSYSC